MGSVSAKWNVLANNEGLFSVEDVYGILTHTEVTTRSFMFEPKGPTFMLFLSYEKSPVAEADATQVT